MIYDSDLNVKDLWLLDIGFEQMKGFIDGLDVSKECKRLADRLRERYFLLQLKDIIRKYVIDMIDVKSVEFDKVSYVCAEDLDGRQIELLFQVATKDTFDFLEKLEWFTNREDDRLSFLEAIPKLPLPCREGLGEGCIP